jgi:hypothetical protein
MTVLKERVRELRPVYLPPDPASRTTYEPGEFAQCDLWFPDTDIPLGAGQNGRGKVPVIIPNRRTGTVRESASRPEPRKCREVAGTRVANVRHRAVGIVSTSAGSSGDRPARIAL